MSLLINVSAVRTRSYVARKVTTDRAVAVVVPKALPATLPTVTGATIPAGIFGRIG